MTGLVDSTEWTQTPWVRRSCPGYDDLVPDTAREIARIVMSDDAITIDVDASGLKAIRSDGRILAAVRMNAEHPLLAGSIAQVDLRTAFATLLTSAADAPVVEPTEECPASETVAYGAALAVDLAGMAADQGVLWTFTGATPLCPANITFLTDGGYASHRLTPMIAGTVMLTVDSGTVVLKPHQDGELHPLGPLSPIERLRMEAACR